MLKVAIIGFGGIAKAVHVGAYTQLAEQGKVKLVAVCDIREDAFVQQQEINIGGSSSLLDETVHCYNDWREMLDKEEIDLVDVCLPTFLHAPVTIEALKSGHHVLCEKPMSLSYDECLQMIDAAKAAGKQLMIGQCLRFGNKYRYLKKIVDEGTFGKVKAAYFHRLSAPPVWGWNNWFMKYELSHGCIQDMHIHDIDIARCIFGEPADVSCITTDVYCGKDSARSTLRYDGFSVLAVGDWSLEGMPFSADYLVSFENATVEYKYDVIMVYPRGGEAYKPPVESDNFYYNEIDYFTDFIENGGENKLNPPESAAKSIKLIETLIKSSDNGGDFTAFYAE